MMSYETHKGITVLKSFSSAISLLAVILLFCKKDRLCLFSEITSEARLKSATSFELGHFSQFSETEIAIHISQLYK